MRVTEKTHAYDVLVALHQCVIPPAPHLGVVGGIDVPDNEGVATCSLDLRKLVFKPSDLVARIIFNPR